MSLPVIVYVLTALAVVVVVLTWLRMRGGRGAARVFLGRRLVWVHTVCGLLGAVVWIAFLAAPGDTMVGSATTGIVGLGLWWIVTVAGLMMLARWLPARGKHATSARSDGWSRGPALSVLGHLAMLAIVCVLTFAYLTAAV